MGDLPTPCPSCAACSPAGSPREPGLPAPIRIPPISPVVVTICFLEGTVLPTSEPVPSCCRHVCPSLVSVGLAPPPPAGHLNVTSSEGLCDHTTGSGPSPQGSPSHGHQADLIYLLTAVCSELPLSQTLSWALGHTGNLVEALFPWIRSHLRVFSLSCYM